MAFSDKPEPSFWMSLSIEIPLVLLGIVLHQLSGHKIELYSKQHGRVVLVSEGLVAVILGCITGAIVKYVAPEQVVELDSDIFWYFVLPPLMVYQALKLERATFFRQLPFMIVFGLFGTLLMFGLLTLMGYLFSRWPWVWRAECTHNFFVAQDTSDAKDACLEGFSLTKSALLAAILSASDGAAALRHIRPEKHRRLASLILGENVLNESLSILIFKATFDDVVSEGREVGHMTAVRALVLLAAAVGIGLAVGLACCRLLLRIPTLRLYDPVRQVALVLLTYYLAYGIAEVLELSGTLTLLLSALVIGHYGHCNLSKEARDGSALTLEMLAGVADAFSFLYIGLSLAGLSGRYNLRFSLLMFASVLLCRLVSALLLFLVLLLWTGRAPLPRRQLLVFIVAGMVRGNVSWVQALQVSFVDHEISSTVLVVVLLSMLLAEVLLPVLVHRLLPPQADSRGDEASAYSLLLPIKDSNDEGGDEGGSDAGSEEGSLYSASSTTSAGTREQSRVARAFAKLDRQVLVKLFAGPRYGIEEEDSHSTPPSDTAHREGRTCGTEEEGEEDEGHMPAPHDATTTGVSLHPSASPSAPVSPLSVLLGDGVHGGGWHGSGTDSPRPEEGRATGGAAQIGGAGPQVFAPRPS